MSFASARPQLSAVLLGLVGTLSQGGCAKQASVEPAPAFSAARYAESWSDRFAYIDHSGHGTDMQAPGHAVEQVVEQCVSGAPPAEAVDAVARFGLSNIRECWTQMDGQRAASSLRASHPTGEVYFGRRPDGGEWTVHHPKLSAVTSFDIGSTWAARHGDHQLRGCQVERTPWCGDGFAVACLSLTPHRLTWVRNHWCPSHGAMGHEGLVVTKGEVPFWSWSSAPRRNDSPLPDLPLDQRPVPELELLMSVAAQLTPELLQAMSPDDVRLPE